MTTLAEWLARRERNRQIRAELAAARAIGKQRRHASRLRGPRGTDRKEPSNDTPDPNACDLLR